MRVPAPMNRKDQHRRGALRVAHAQTVGDGHRLGQFRRPPGPGDGGVSKPSGGRRGLLAGPAFGDRTDRQQHRHRVGGGSSLELGDEPADQRVLKDLTGPRTNRYPRRANEFRVHRVLVQVRSRRDHLIDHPLRVQAFTRTRRAIAFGGSVHCRRQGRPPGGLGFPLAFPAAADRAHGPSLPTHQHHVAHPTGVCRQHRVNSGFAGSSGTTGPAQPARDNRPGTTGPAQPPGTTAPGTTAPGTTAPGTS